MTQFADKVLRAPFPWFGGKSRAAPLMWERIGKVINLVIPFFASGAELLACPKAQRPRVETVNDINCFVSNFWRAVSEDAEGVARAADWPVNECVPAGTMIATPDGDVPIERIAAGMVVWGFDGSRVVPTVVTATKQSTTSEAFVRIGPLALTPNHPVWTDAGYIEAGSLRHGMIIGIMVYDGALGEATCGVGGSTRGEDALGGASSQDRGIHENAEARCLRRDGGNLRIDHRRLSGAEGIGGVGLPGATQGVSLQRSESAPGVARAVYNFQTETANYFAAGVLVHNCDLHARHRWLLAQAEGLRERLDADPDYYDVKIAAWWVWGLSAWIGNGWCEESSPKGHERRMPSIGTRQVGEGGGHETGRGIHAAGMREPSRQLPDMGGRKHRDGTGGNGTGRGVHGAARTRLYDIFRDLAERLRYVRVACGDWSRICTPAITYRHGLTAVILDPPYEGHEHVYGNTSEIRTSEIRTMPSEQQIAKMDVEDRAMWRDLQPWFEAEAIDPRDRGLLYGPRRELPVEKRRALPLSKHVGAWARAYGERPDMRIVLCGYEGEHDMPATWECVAWSAKGGYSNQGEGENENRKRERLWFSPSCLRPGVNVGQLDMFGGGQ